MDTEALKSIAIQNARAEFCTLAERLQAAKADLAFALAQGDGYAEDAAAERIAEIESKIAAVPDSRRA
jgi:hypothetical protein